MRGIATKFVACLLSEQQQENMSTHGRTFKGGLKGTRDFSEDNHR
jgi:hypothetical protein